MKTIIKPFPLIFRMNFATHSNADGPFLKATSNASAPFIP